MGGMERFLQFISRQIVILAICIYHEFQRLQDEEKEKRG